VFRGYLTQAIGVFAARPWLPAILTALLFAAAHGTEQGAWLFANRVGFGLVAAWLVFRTGGLEAPIALHLVPNILSFVTTTADGNLGMFVRGVEEPVPPAVAVLDLAVVTVVAAWLARSARSRGVARVRPNGGAQGVR